MAVVTASPDNVNTYFLFMTLKMWAVMLLIVVAEIGSVGWIIQHKQQLVVQAPDWPWEGPDTAAIPPTQEGNQIRYGRALVANTAHYLGPKGTVKAISNGMNCQNCHLEAGTQPWGNNYSAVATTYPRYRERSGSIESVEKRINDCLERSLNGRALDSNSRELKAMTAYIKWVGKEVKRNSKPLGSGIRSLPYLGRAADSARGALVYSQYCGRCHGAAGQGVLKEPLPGYLYPPLWGPHSYNTGAGLFRLSKLAGYVKDNMPFGEASHYKPVLTDEEAWDVAAFINMQVRTTRIFPKDWPMTSAKPVDHPFGPFADTFSARRHKLGPFTGLQAPKQKG
jgi:thiosulfate dehydrogenase